MINNLALVTDIKQNIGDRIVGYAEKDKIYILQVTAKGEPRLQFHLQDETTGKFILCVNRIATMLATTYTYRFQAPDDSILVWDISGNGMGHIDYFGLEEDYRK